MNLHELKDIVTIYGGRAWDKADIILWDPAGKTQYNLSFTGSAKPGTDADYPDGRISFNLSKRSISSHERDMINLLEQINVMRGLIDGFTDSRNKLIEKYNKECFNEGEDTNDINPFYLARDEDGILTAYNEKPVKDESIGSWIINDIDNPDSDAEIISGLDDDYGFRDEVKWGDEEPTEAIYGGSFEDFVKALKEQRDEYIQANEPDEDHNKEFFYLSRSRIGLWLSDSPDKKEFITDNPRFMKRVKLNESPVPINSNGQTFDQILNMLRKQAGWVR